MSRKTPVVVITGASSGIGRATALRFAREGARVVLASRREQALEELAEECRALGASALAVPTDVTSPEAMQMLADAAVEEFGSLDVWVNNAAVAVYAPFATVPLEDFRRVLDVNVLGYVYGAKAALPYMVEQGRGVLVNVASIVGEIPQPYTASYGMSKAAVRALGVSLRQELVLQGIRKVKVATVLPPTIDTPFFRHAANYTGRKVLAMPPVYTPDKVARAIVRMSRSPEAELVLGAAGKAMVRQHRRHPAVVEAQMAAMVENTHLSQREEADDTEGVLFAPADAADASKTGGWHGRRHLARRRALTWLLLLGGGVVATRKLRQGRVRSLAR